MERMGAASPPERNKRYNKELTIVPMHVDDTMGQA
jgi:hypothetical protein